MDKINNLYQPTITLIAVKPNQLKTLNGLDKDNRLGNSIIVSVVAGKKIKDLNKVFKKTSGIVRAMTNTPVSVNRAPQLYVLREKLKQNKKNLFLISCPYWGKSVKPKKKI